MSGFSLIEILVVVAIIALVSGFAVTSISSMGQARGVSEAAFQVAAAVELARAEAIARNSFTWLAIDESTASGSRDLVLGLMASKDGSLSTDPTNLQPIGRAQVIRQVGITTANELPSGATNLSSHSGGPTTFRIGQTTFPSGRTLLFSPSGEISLTPPASSTDFQFQGLMALGLQPARGTDFLDANNPVDVLIDGSTGLPQVRRPGDSTTP